MPQPIAQTPAQPIMVPPQNASNMPSACDHPDQGRKLHVENTGRDQRNHASRIAPHGDDEQAECLLIES